MSDYLDDYRASGRRTSGTKEAAERAVSRIIAGIGHIRLDCVTPDLLNQFYRDTEGAPYAGARAGQGSLSASTVHHWHRHLTSALRDAVERAIIPVNPATQRRTEPPKPNKERGQAVPLEEAHAILRHVRDQDPTFWPMLATTAVSAMRIGEVLGLRRGDIEWHDRLAIIHVQVQRGRDLPAAAPIKPRTKTRASQAPVALGPIASDILARHLADQETTRAEARGLYVDLGLVFPTSLGTGQNSSNVRSRHWRTALEAIGLGDRTYRPHDLRHNATTRAYEGMALEAAQALARHASPAMTRHYIHSLRAAERVEQILLAPVLAGTSSDGPEPSTV